MGFQDENGQPMPAMPQIVIIIDELADLMMAAPRGGGGYHLPLGTAGPRCWDASRGSNAASFRGCGDRFD